MTENTDADDSISLSDIFWRLWDRRGIIVLVPLLLVGFAVLFVVVSSLVQDRPVTHLISLRNIENQRYPNGTEFSPRDLLIPEVLTELRRRFDIAPDIDIREAVSVAYDSPLAAGISQKYQQRLAARNLSQAEIDALNQSYLEELRSSMRSSLRINVDYRALGLDSAAGLAIASELPRLWSSIYTTKYRIFVDRRLADLAVTRSEEDLATTGSVITANARLSAMRRGLDTFTGDNRFAMLRTPDGKSAADLIIELNNFNSIWFNPVKAQAFRGTDTTASAYLDELRLSIAEKRRQIGAFDATLAGLVDYQKSGQPLQVGQPAVVPGEQGNTIQFGDSSFAGIVQLAQQASFSGFVQRTLDERRDLMIELSALEREQEFALNTADSVAVTAQFRAQAAEILRDLTAEYVQLVRGAEDVTRSRAGDLSEPLYGPAVTGVSLLSSRNILTIAAAGLAGGLLAVLGVLLASTIKRRPNPRSRESV